MESTSFRSNLDSRGARDDEQGLDGFGTLTVALFRASGLGTEEPHLSTSVSAVQHGLAHEQHELATQVLGKLACRGLVQMKLLARPWDLNVSVTDVMNIQGDDRGPCPSVETKSSPQKRATVARPLGQELKHPPSYRVLFLPYIVHLDDVLGYLRGAHRRAINLGCRSEIDEDTGIARASIQMGDTCRIDLDIPRWNSNLPVPLATEGPHIGLPGLVPRR